MSAGPIPARSGDTIGVLLAVLALLVALALGYAFGGSLQRLGSLSLRRGRLVVAAVLVQLAGGLVGGPAYPLGLAVSAVLVGGFLLYNRGIQGTGLVALGLLSNALVVGANGAMPVSRDALVRAGISSQDLLTGQDPRHELADAATYLPALGDVVPVLLPFRPEVLSAGDVLVSSGLAQLVFVGMTRRRRVKAVARRPRPPLALRPRSPVALWLSSSTRQQASRGEPHGQEGSQAPRP